MNKKVGLPMGVAVGTAIGVAISVVTNNIVMLPIGTSFCCALGIALGSKSDKKDYVSDIDINARTYFWHLY